VWWWQVEHGLLVLNSTTTKSFWWLQARRASFQLPILGLKSLYFLFEFRHLRYQLLIRFRLLAYRVKYTSHRRKFSGAVKDELFKPVELVRYIHIDALLFDRTVRCNFVIILILNPSSNIIHIDFSVNPTVPIEPSDRPSQTEYRKRVPCQCGIRFADFHLNFAFAVANFARHSKISAHG
jgi:hypothetical protein